jgi:signal transduction histidine kinase
MFQSATLKLTGWYLLILMAISILFSVAIYNVTTNEVGERLQQLQTRFERRELDGLSTPPPWLTTGDPTYAQLRAEQNERAGHNLLIALYYVNLLILIAGGAGSYFLARRTLGPIEEAHEAQSRFTSDASHELRTPLAVMKMELEVALRDKDLTKAAMREQLESNLEEVNKLSDLAQTLLQLSRLDHGKLEREQLSLNSIVNDVIKRYDKTGKRVAFNKSTKNHILYANRASVEELVTILVDNALKYSPDDSLVQIATSRRDRRACLEVTNTGEGISADDLPHIFDRFYRADTARTKSSAQTGHGLGLALAKQIVQLHGGELSATSAPGHATTFTVLLPLFHEDTAVSQK